MSLRTRLLWLFGLLAVALVGLQAWWGHRLAEELTAEVGSVVETVGQEVLQVVGDHQFDGLAISAEFSTEAEIPSGVRGLLEAVGGLSIAASADRREVTPAVQEMLEALDGDVEEDVSLAVEFEVVDNQQLSVLLSGPTFDKHIPIPSSGVQQRVDRFSSRLVVGSLALLLAALALAAWGTHHLTAPLRSLVDAARRVGGGELGHQVVVSATGEVGETVEAFNRMSAHLEALDRHNRELQASQHLGEIGEIGRGLAHALRNPLNALGLSVEELIAAEAADDRRALASSARSQIRRIDASIRSFLAVATTGAEVTTIDVAKLVDDVALAVMQEMTGAVEVGEVDGGSELRGVAQELRVAIHALVVNAVEASLDDQSVRVSVRGTADWIEVVVDDDGPGLSPSVKERLFEPHVTTKATGSGMGLFLARRIATARYGGDLVLDERPEGGTRATLRLGRARRGTDG